MLLIIEILMLIGGIATIATGKLPAFVMGGGQYTLEGSRARLFGFLFVLPLPFAFASGIVLGILFGEKGVGVATLLELIITISAVILAVIIFRFIRQPVIATNSSGQILSETTNIESLIARKAYGALIYSLLGIFGFTAIIVCPLAFLYGTQALRLINTNKVGEQHRTIANLARIIASVIFLFYAGIIVVFVMVVTFGNR